MEDMLAQADISVKEIAKLGKELSELSRLTALTDERTDKLKTIEELRSVEKDEATKGADGEEMRQMAEEERIASEAALSEIEDAIVRIITPKDAGDGKGVILEVRAGTGW